MVNHAQGTAVDTIDDKGCSVLLHQQEKYNRLILHTHPPDSSALRQLFKCSTVLSLLWTELQSPGLHLIHYCLVWDFHSPT